MKKYSSQILYPPMRKTDKAHSVHTSLRIRKTLHIFCSEYVKNLCVIIRTFKWPLTSGCFLATHLSVQIKIKFCREKNIKNIKNWNKAVDLHFFQSFPSFLCKSTLKFILKILEVLAGLHTWTNRCLKPGICQNVLLIQKDILTQKWGHSDDSTV